MKFDEATARLLADGGSSEVFAIAQGDYPVPVVLKCLRPEVLRFAIARQAFAQEIHHSLIE